MNTGPATDSGEDRVFFAAGGQALAQGTWTTKAPMPTARAALGVGVVNNILYAVGGNDGVSALAAVEAYDPATNTWSTKASMPTARQELSVGVVNGILYALEGANAPGNSTIAAVEAYDPATDTWSTKAFPPIASFLQGVGVVNSTLYAVGGGNGATCFAANQAYDAASDTWTVKASMSTDRVAPGAGVVNGILFAAGGGSCTAGILASGEAYDPATDTWTPIAPMPTARFSLSAGVVNGVLYAIGGTSGAAAALAANEAFALRPIIACSGFEAPFDTSIFLKAKVQRAIPLKMQLSEAGTPITDLNIPGAAPVVDVSFSSGGGPAVDVTDLLEPVGQSSQGNSFNFDAGTGSWVFNLGTKPYSAAGTYTVTAEAGDSSYAISPSCSGQFVRGN